MLFTGRTLKHSKPLIKGNQGTTKSTNKETKKQMTETRKIFDARARGYNMKHLLETLIQHIGSKHLFEII